MKKALHARLPRFFPDSLLRPFGYTVEAQPSVSLMMWTVAAFSEFRSTTDRQPQTHQHHVARRPVQKAL